MAYGLRYTLTQILRDETSSVVNIYDKGYVGSVTAYDATNLQIQANSSEDEPLPQIISSQLNISFIIPLADNSTTFPDLLSFDDRKYYVEYVNAGNILWVGFLFNDYVQVPFTTGYVQVDLIATDGLKLLEYAKYNLIDLGDTNQTTTLIDAIANCLNVIDYPIQLSLVTSCSYYAQDMVDTGGASPFSQTYQFRRDYLGLNCYEVLTNIITSFGCRLFQSDGKWQLLTINEQASTTQYYTEFTIDPTVTTSAFGTLDNNITINPYSLGNIHFIDNSQTKIIRKGYPRLVLTSTWEGATNYLHNGDFKAYTDLYSTNGIVGWTRGKTGGALASINEFTVNNESDSNDVFMALFTTGVTSFLYSGTSLGSTAYLPYMNKPSFSVGFQYKIQEAGQRAKMTVSLKDSVTGVTWYYNQSNAWQTTSTYIFIVYAGNGEAVSSSSAWSSYSKEFSLISPAVTTPIEGHVRVNIFVDDYNGGISNINVRGLNVSQSLLDTKSLRVTRYVSDVISTTKQLEQPYGFWTISLLKNNYKGVLFDNLDNYLKNWYKKGFGSTYGNLQELIAHQYSNILNKNFCTLEGDLGTFQTENGLNYLNKNITITDASTNALSYNGKKFLMNRASITPYMDEVNSIQLIEITNANNDSTAIVEYLSE
jgi:hypothetical protein